MLTIMYCSSASPGRGGTGTVLYAICMASGHCCWWWWYGVVVALYYSWWLWWLGLNLILVVPGRCSGVGSAGGGD